MYTDSFASDFSHIDLKKRKKKKKKSALSKDLNDIYNPFQWHHIGSVTQQWAAGVLQAFKAQQ